MHKALSTFKITALSLFVLIFFFNSGPISAFKKKVPVLLSWDTLYKEYCAASALVEGLKEDGDGFLSVRTAPHTSYESIDQIHNGQRVTICDKRGDWYGVVYTKKDTDCFAHLPTGLTTPYKGRCWSGWVHKNWIGEIAG